MELDVAVNLCCFFSCVFVPNMITMLSMPFDVGKLFVTADKLFPESCNVYFSMAFTVPLVMFFVYLISDLSKNSFLVLFSKWYWVSIRNEFLFLAAVSYFDQLLLFESVDWGFN